MYHLKYDHTVEIIYNQIVVGSIFISLLKSFDLFWEKFGTFSKFSLNLKQD